MIDLESLYVSLRLDIATALPGVVAQGIWEREHIDLVPWESLPDPPFAVITIGEMLEADYGLDNLCFTLPVDVWLVYAITGDSGALRPQMMTLMNYVWTNDLTYGQVMRVPRGAYSEDLLFNRIALEKGYMHRAGLIEFEVLVGQTN